jgi:hypothetical protein
MFAYLEIKKRLRGLTMRLTRREILEELGRLGITNLSALKRACREFEQYWDCLMSGTLKSTT